MKAFINTMLKNSDDQTNYIEKCKVDNTKYHIILKLNFLRIVLTFQNLDDKAIISFKKRNKYETDNK